MTHADLKEAAERAINSSEGAMTVRPARILSLIEENERMREALTPFAEFVAKIDAHETARQAADSFVIHDGLTVGDFRRALAALKEKQP